MSTLLYLQTEAARTEILEELDGSAELEVRDLDLASFASIREFAAKAMCFRFDSP